MPEILVVDDDPAVVDSVAAVLRERGHRVEVALDGGLALAVLAAHQFDLLLVDCGMPGIGGMEFVWRVRAQGELVPIVLMTSFAGTPDLPHRIDILRKPFGIDDLLVAVETLALVPGRG